VASKYRVGDLDVYLVSDGINYTDVGGLFGLVPKALWSKVTSADEKNRVPMYLRSLYLESEGKKILVDTGYGDKLSEKMRAILGLGPEKMRLVNDLRSIGVEPEAIDVVILTHLHGDHCGGNTYWDENGRVRPTFPNATYFAQRQELGEAMFPDERTRGTYFADNFRPLLESDQLRVIDGDTEITAHVRTKVARGHTPSYQAVVVESDGEAALFLGDACPWGIFLERLGWVSSFDIEPLASITSKKMLGGWAVRHHARLFFQHDALMESAFVRREGDKFVLVDPVKVPRP